VQKKKVLLFVIDALSSRVVERLMQDGKLPTFAALAEAGAVDWNCISIFPSITPAATASIITGCYPTQHGIVGDYWYNRERNQVAYFGADFAVIWNQGFGSFFHDFLDRLNEEIVECRTVFDMVADAGLRSASLNYLIFHGPVTHAVDVPLLLELLPGVAYDSELHGPDILQLGDFVVPQQIARAGGLQQSGAMNRYGFEDRHAHQVLLELAYTNSLPDLTVTYWPDNDFNSHAVGPVESGTTLIQADTYLDQFAALFGGVEQLLQEYCLVITGDHAQADMVKDIDRAGIDLHLLLEEFSIAEVGQAWQDEDLLICPNLRMGHIYLSQRAGSMIERIADRLLQDERIDQVLWPASLTDNAPGFVVATHDRGRLRFTEAEGEDGREPARDVYGTTWHWEGDLATVDGRVEEGLIMFGDYPNAFERIANGLRNHNGGLIWLTARPGYEFRLPGMEVHPGGSHGSLHLLDSTVPLFIAGAPAGLELPRNPRTIDVAGICTQALGILP
jgi:predicted AlkP superfamily pyrophosphatase or phosphodiesterase